jgi:acetolactate synthase-1/2/3 large subunit
MAGGVVKAVFRVDHEAQIPDQLADAFQAAASGEPGPVLVEVAAGAVTTAAGALGAVRRYVPDAQAVVAAAGSVRHRLRAARRPLILAGQGAAGGSESLRRLAEGLECPVVTTLSGRGALPEDHPLHLAIDMGGEGVHVLNEAIAAADLVLALGCKFTHNGSGGFRLVLPAERLVHVDASAEVAGVNYPAGLVAVADVPELLAALAGDQWSRSEWTREEVAGFRARGAEANGRGRVEPRVHGGSPGTAEALFRAVRGALPRETILVTDSGLHQSLARRHWPVLSPRGFIAPSDFQSMGFGIPAGIGAAIAAPGRPVVVVTGDGGFNMAGLELLTAVRDRIPLTVVVFNDGQYGLIRLQQMGDYGHTHGVAIATPDYAAFASSIGADYRLVDGDPGAAVSAAPGGGRATLVEVAIGDSVDMAILRARSAAREALRGAVPAGVVGWLKRRLR